MDEKIRILIADDHPIFRSGLRQVIEADGSMSVIAEAEDGSSALKLIRAHKPDIAVLDINMPGVSGFDVVASIRKENLSSEVVLLTMYNEEAMFAKAVNLGVRGYVLKESATNDILNCLHAVRKGQNYTSAQLTKYLFKRASVHSNTVEGLDSLTPTERRVLALIAGYLTSREIAERLGISVRTVENHRNNICAKVGVHGSHALTKFALQHQTEL